LSCGAGAGSSGAGVIAPVESLVDAPGGALPLYPRQHMTRIASEAILVGTDDSEAWLAALRGPASVRDEAIATLHALLLRGAHFELNRRRGMLDHVPPGERGDLATEAADDALVAILAKLDTFRGASRFTTWACKFVLLEAGVKARRRAWHGREVCLDAETWPMVAEASAGAQQAVEEHELLRAIGDAVRTQLTPHQREVFSALALNGVPIDVLAERLSTTRGALYTTLHDARRKLRTALAAAGHSLDDHGYTGGGT
jgi:RNA polymerase sigma-70 factor, ECF subfamily